MCACVRESAERGGGAREATTLEVESLKGTLHILMGPLVSEHYLLIFQNIEGRF